MFYYYFTCKHSIRLFQKFCSFYCRVFVDPYLNKYLFYSVVVYRVGHIRRKDVFFQSWKKHIFCCSFKKSFNMVQGDLCTSFFGYDIS